MSKTIRILICDDDPIVHQSLSLYLDNEDFLHDSAYDGRQALDMIKKEHYDLMLLDQMMPGMTGMEVCQAVRKDSQLPIIMLTARGEEIDRILGLEMGADDYIVKPFSPREVVSRIKAVLRRTCAAPDTTQEEKLTTLTYGSLEIQPERYSVKLAGQSVACTPREGELLYLLASHPGRVFDREQILSRIWGYDFFGDTRTVDLKAIQEPHGISAWCFVPAIALALLPLVSERVMWAIYAANAVGAASCLACFRWAFRRRAELVDADTDLTNTLTRIRRRSWERIWLALVSLAVWLSDGNPVRSLLGILLASAIVVIAVLRIEFKTRELQARLTESSGRGWYADEDDKWLGGVVYYDPHDTRTVVNCRVGSSTTVNLARPSGRVLAGMVALVLLAMPFTGALIDAVTNRPTSLELTNTELVAYCGDKSAYRIERADIESAELLDELPEHLVRSVGTGAENLLKGDFSAAEYGRLKLCLDPTCPPFLLVECAGGETYLLGSRTEGETEVIFGEIGA